MKKNFLLNLILLISASLPAQLKWLNPTPSGWINSKIHFINDSTGYLMNYNGDLFITNDTGNTWQNHGNFPGAQTFKIRDSTGIMTALDSSIYVSSDNGATWLKNINSPGGILVNNWCDIVERDTIFVLTNINGFVSALYKSVNRGASWELVNNDINQFFNTTIDFLTSKIGYAARPGEIVKTTDGGATWQTKYSGAVRNLKFFDTLNGLAYNETSGMLRTIDGGLTWTEFYQPADDIYDIFYVDSLNVYASGEHGVVYKTTDGGSTWTWVSPSGRIYAYDLYTQYFFNANDGIVAGHRGRLLRTRNAGASWERHSPTYIDVTGISFGNHTTGYATTWNNLYKTTDSGTTWDSLTLTTTGINTRFEYCRFSSRDTGIVTTSEPAEIYKTVNGGQTWTVNDPSSPLFGQFTNISSMSFFSKDTGYISLRGSVNGIFKTFNGGSNWTEIGSFQNFNLLYFLNDQFGYGTVYDRIYRTSDGGMTWWLSPVPPADHPFNSIYFLNPSKGFTVGDQGQLKMTLDSAQTWTDIILEPFQLPHYKSISFYNDRIGYITTGQFDGSYYKTTDGGYHWNKNGTIASYECRSILFRPDTTVIFAGQYGSIVSRDIADYGIDSVKVNPAICNVEFSAKISAFLSPVDSIWFQYGKNAYTDIITGSPVGVADTTLHITVVVNNLLPDSVYHMRVKILFNGNYYYSTDFVFTPKKAEAPVITASGNVLSSSVATGNQWYLNGTLISGTAGQQYTAAVSGAYTVIATQSGCPTLESAVYNLTLTAVPDTSAGGREIQIYPNPVLEDNEIKIVVSSTNRLVLQIADIRGHVVKEQALRNGTNELSLRQLQAGMYIFIITDTQTFETVKRMVLKL